MSVEVLHMEWKEAVLKAILKLFMLLKWVNSLKLRDFFFLYTMAMSQFTSSFFSTAFNP